jgi:chromosome segregation ATPase
MKRIYKSFDQLMEENGKIFDVLKERGGEGFYRAIWDARDAEIEKLKEDLELKTSEQESSEKKMMDLQKLTKEQERLVKESKQAEEAADFIVQGLKQQIIVFKEERKGLLVENKENKNIKIKMGKVCEQLNHMQKSLSQSQRGEVDLTKMIHSLKSKKEELGETYSKLKKREMSLGYELDKYKKNFSQLKHEFKRQQKQLKMSLQNLEKFETMNHKMESELCRLNGDIRSLRPSNMKEILGPMEQ